MTTQEDTHSPAIYESAAYNNEHLSDQVELLLWIVVILDIICLGCLGAIASTFLVQSCKAKQKTARFIIKLLILVLLVSISGAINALHEAPWFQKTTLFNSGPDIVLSCITEFVFWVAAQWSTWIIAFQFYSTAE